MAYYETSECRGCHADKPTGESGLCSSCFDAFTSRRQPIRREPQRPIARQAAAQRRLAERRRARQAAE